MFLSQQEQQTQQQQRFKSALDSGKMSRKGSGNLPSIPISTSGNSSSRRSSGSMTSHDSSLISTASYSAMAGTAEVPQRRASSEPVEIRKTAPMLVIDTTTPFIPTNFYANNSSSGAHYHGSSNNNNNNNNDNNSIIGSNININIDIDADEENGSHHHYNLRSNSNHINENYLSPPSFPSTHHHQQTYYESQRQQQHPPPQQKQQQPQLLRKPKFSNSSSSGPTLFPFEEEMATANSLPSIASTSPSPNHHSQQRTNDHSPQQQPQPLHHTSEYGNFDMELFSESISSSYSEYHYGNSLPHSFTMPNFTNCETTPRGIPHSTSHHSLSTSPFRGGVSPTRYDTSHPYIPTKKKRGGSKNSDEFDTTGSSFQLSSRNRSLSSSKEYLSKRGGRRNAMPNLLDPRNSPNNMSLLIAGSLPDFLEYSHRHGMVQSKSLDNFIEDLQCSSGLSTPLTSSNNNICDSAPASANITTPPRLTQDIEEQFGRFQFG